MRTSILGLGAFALIGVSAAADAQLVAGQSGRIDFNSVNITSGGSYALAKRLYDPTPVPIFGTLLLPTDLSAKVPAMVIKHGSAPPSENREFEWAHVLTSMGIAAFVVDSYTPRGITQTDQTTLSAWTDVADSLKALELLATHPNIDPNRIGIMGGSRGGFVAAVTAYEEIRQGIIDGPLKFAAHIPLYPGCSNRFWSHNLTGAPLLYLLGALDNFTPALHCTEFTQLLASLGADVTTIVYPDTYHDFDGGTVDGPVTAPKWHPEYITSKNCALEIRLDTWVKRRYDTGQVLGNAEMKEYLASCRTSGATVDANPVAEAQAVKDVQIFLARVFGLHDITLPADQPDRIFNWAQDAFPQYFQPRGVQSQTGYGYYYRCYAASGSCLGMKDSRVYYLLPAIDPNRIFDAGGEAPLLDTAIQAGY